MVAESAGPAGPAGRNNDQIGVQRHAVGADTGGPVAPDADLDDMAIMQIHSRLGLHGRSEDPLEGRPAASHRHQLLGPVRSWRTGHRLGTGGEQVVRHLGQFRLPRLDHLGAKCVRVVKLHHPTQQPPAGDRGDQPDRDVRGQPGSWASAAAATALSASPSREPVGARVEMTSRSSWASRLTAWRAATRRARRAPRAASGGP